jgi:Uma2 family endonuclease
MTDMASKLALTEAEYLRTSFPDLDREFCDGEVIERSMPDPLHSRAQGKLSYIFFQAEARLNAQVFPELRVKLRPGRHVVPDVCVYWPAGSIASLSGRSPLIAIEILSEEDRLSKVRGKLEEYAHWGVRHIWLLDPHRKLFYLFRDGLHEVKSYTVEEIAFTLTPEQVFD